MAAVALFSLLLLLFFMSRVVCLSRASVYRLRFFFWLLDVYVSCCTLYGSIEARGCLILGMRALFA